MENELFGFDVTSEYAQVETQKNEAFPSWLMEDVQGFALFMLDKDGRVSHWNHGARRLIGYTDKEIIGEQFSRLYNSRETQMQQMSPFCLNIAAKQGFYETKGWWVHQGTPNFFAQVIIIHNTNDGGGFAIMIWDFLKNRRAAAESDDAR